MSFGQGRIQVGCLHAVGIPSLAAFMSGVFVGVVFAAGAMLWGEGDVGLTALFFGSLGGLIAWPFCLGWWSNILLGGAQPKPRNYSYSTHLEIVTNEGRTSQIINLPGTPEQISYFAHGVLSGKSLTEASWVGRGFTRSEFVELRDAIIKGKLGYWKNTNRPQDGWGITRSGIAALKFLASERGKTPPLSEDGLTLLQDV